MRRRGWDTRAGLCYTLAIGAMLLLGACDSAPKQAESDEPAPLTEDVKLSDLRTHSASPHVAPPLPTVPKLAPKYDRRLVMQMLALPEHSPRVAIAAAALEEPSIDAATLARWRANGFGVGSLPVDRVSLFTANLPRAYISPVFRMGVTSTYNPVTLIDRLRGVVRFDYHDAAGGDEAMKFIGGQCQLMVRLEAPLDNVGPLKIDLLPHHYSPETRLLPSATHERALEGSSFDDLRIYQPIEDDHVLVIYLNSPTAGQTPPEEAENAEAAEKTDEKAEAEKPRTLADAMLRGRNGSRAIQWLVMIGLEQRSDEPESPESEKTTVVMPSAAANRTMSAHLP
ncbi:hypothetical protein HED60_03975 [Planctomycetales bacterium ZRK34]|nr:hypothetical protein HED60_03975 [Planctomycetales bacterium ZRK34]